MSQDRVKLSMENLDGFYSNMQTSVQLLVLQHNTLATLDSWVAATRLDKLVPYITASMTDAKLGVEGRKDLFAWLSKQFTRLAKFLDAIQLLRPVVVAMTDNSANVRKAAEMCFGDIVRVGGQQMMFVDQKR